MPRVGLAWNPAGLGEAVGHYALGRIGTLRVEGAWEAATAKAGDATWRFKARGRSVVVTTTEAAGRAVGEYNDRTRVLRWDSRELDLRRGLGRRRSTLADNAQIVVFPRADGRDWRLNPINVEFPDATAAEPGVLLLAAFVGARLAHRDRNNDGL
jgi:hypothetical protein